MCACDREGERKQSAAVSTTGVAGNGTALKDFMFCGHLDRCAVWLGDCFQTFRRNLPPPSSGLCVLELTHKPGDEGSVRFFEGSRRTWPITRRKDPEDPISQQSGGANLKSQFSKC